MNNNKARINLQDNLQLNKNTLTIWSKQYCSGPQTSQQLAFAAAWVHIELVCVTGLPDTFCLLHPDTKTQKIEEEI